MITKATYKFEYFITIKSNFNIFTHIDKTNAVKNEIYKFTLPHRYILIPTSFQMKLGKLHSLKFANAYRILDLFFKMLPTCFTFDNIHTMKFQQLYIGRNNFLSVNALKYSLQYSHLSSSFCRKSDENPQLTCYLLYQFAVYTKTGRQSRLPCNVLCAGSGFQASCAYILRNKIFATVSAYRKLRALIGLILS